MVYLAFVTFMTITHVAVAAPEIGDVVVVRAGARSFDAPYGDERGTVNRARARKLTGVSEG